MIDKKKLIDELIECVQDATDCETQITGLTLCAILMNEILDEALTLTDVGCSYSEKHLEEEYNKGYKDAMVKYRE